MLWNMANPGFVTQFSLLQLLVAQTLHDWFLLKDAACVALVGHLRLTSQRANLQSARVRRSVESVHKPARNA